VPYRRYDIDEFAVPARHERRRRVLRRDGRDGRRKVDGLLRCVADGGHVRRGAEGGTTKRRSLCASSSRAGRDRVRHGHGV